CAGGTRGHSAYRSVERLLPARPQRGVWGSCRSPAARRSDRQRSCPWNEWRLMYETVTLCSATLADEGQSDPPLGPLYIAAALEQVDVEVDFRDFQVVKGAHGLSGEPLARFLGGHSDIVAISCFVDMLPAVLDATRRLHAARP